MNCIRELRQARGWTQEHLAYVAKTNTALVSCLEREKDDDPNYPSDEVIERIWEALNSNIGPHETEDFRMVLQSILSVVGFTKVAQVTGLPKTTVQKLYRGEQIATLCLRLKFAPLFRLYESLKSIEETIQ